MASKKYYINDEGRIVALRDFGDVKAGDVGGFVESEYNLSHAGNCWVSGDAKVFEDARISGESWIDGNATIRGDAEVYGNAWISGNAVATSKVFTCSLTRHDITVTDNYTMIGCEAHPHEYWLENIQVTGMKHNYSPEDIALYTYVVTKLIKAKLSEES